MSPEASPVIEVMDEEPPINEYFSPPLHKLALNLPRLFKTNQMIAIFVGNS
jgi:hypothetical protein